MSAAARPEPFRIWAVNPHRYLAMTATASADHSSDGFQTLCAYARNYIEEYGDKEAVDELERIIASLSQRLATNV